MYKLPYTGAEIEERLAKLDDLNAENFVLSETTADLYGLSGIDSNVDNALKMAFGVTSYLAFCTNANANSLDAGFGKGNEAYINNLGRQLAMYAWFKGDSEATYPFTNLIGKSTFAECVSDPLSKDEMLSNRNIADLIFSSPFAKGSVGNVPVTALPVGEKVKFKVDGLDTQWYIADTTYDGVSAPISVLIPVTSIGTRQFHTSNVNLYSTSSILSYLNGDFYNSIESVVKSNLQSVSVEVGPGNGGSTTVLVSQKVHLPSINEVGLVQDYAPIEGTKIKLFDDVSKRNIGASWWLRTPDFYGTTQVMYINNTGAKAMGNASTVYAVRPIIFLPSSLTVSGTIDGDGCHILV